MKILNWLLIYLFIYFLWLFGAKSEWLIILKVGNIRFFFFNNFVHIYYTMFSVPIGLYGFQHYLSILGSLILIPLVIVPAMGGTPVSSSYNSFEYFHNIYIIYIYISISIYLKKRHCFKIDLTLFSGCRRILQMWYQQCSLFREWPHCCIHLLVRGYPWYRVHRLFIWLLP